MLKYLFAFVLFMHGLIHLMGFAKAFGIGNITQLTKDISKPVGWFWLITAILFLSAAILFLSKKEPWPYIALLAVIISQILIITFWKDAKYGTIANVIVLIISIAGWGNLHFESKFSKDVKSHLQLTAGIQTNLLTEKDIELLPFPIQKYLRYCNVINKPKVKNVRIVFDGEMREKGKDWFAFRSVQYNFFDDPARLFFMKAKMFGLMIPAYHDYQYGNARMNVKLFGMFPMVQVSGAEMNKAETVTLFNDMCLLVPATLIDNSIQWVPVDALSTKAIFTNGKNKISATLYFNKQGQLVNFISDDRYAIGEMKQCQFSTPVKDYTNKNYINVLKNADAVWHYPDGEFVYGKFTLKSIEYNVDDYKP